MSERKKQLPMKNKNSSKTNQSSQIIFSVAIDSNFVKMTDFILTERIASHVRRAQYNIIPWQESVQSALSQQ